MGIIDDKQNILNEIGAIFSARENINLPFRENSLSSINNSREILPFIIDILTVVIGSQALQRTLGELFTNVFDTVEPATKDAIKNTSNSYNSSQTLPSSFNTSGYDIPLNAIDSNKKLQTDPNSNAGALLYGTTNVNTFDYKVYEAIQTPSTNVNYNNIIINYNETTDTINIKPQVPSQTINTFITDYIDDSSILPRDAFVGDIINGIYGTLSSEQNLPLNDLILNEQIDSLIDKINAEEESLIFTQEEQEEFEQRAENKSKGVDIYMTSCCGVITASTTIEEISGLTNIINNFDPEIIGNGFSDLLDNSFPSDQTTSEEDNRTIKDAFFKRLIKLILNTLLKKTILTPEIRTFFIITEAFKNNNTVTPVDPLDFLRNNNNLIQCIRDKIREIIIQFLFELVKRELIKLVIPLTKRILIEKLNQYIGILRSLVGFGV